MMGDGRPQYRGRILGMLLALLGIAVFLALAPTYCARPAQAQVCADCGCTLPNTTSEPILYI
ncbi:hypothetical protein [Methylobacterium nodulans]|uniref:Uncharacterized protein n=1 Tax=Methylobacterium nodulans (strain LMG 21967 / CNCM I-2342 / ORS 2060) TaxID=460265 RepID=B8IQH4_METNO|nr:hypothetical protein [Methylobacterium nodulans]ACL60486.1 hypothetical protein Mnod_5646 [Methylobacterium nodulans ORS 2060]